jgi:penicillin amidase
MELPKSGFFSTVFSALARPVVSYLDRSSLAKYDGELTIAGLNHPVKVDWDGYAIPHVAAASEHDLFIAQGYLHAQERLWQMELSRRFLAGRMAEIFGDFSLPWKELSDAFRGRTSADFDYFIRLLGIRHAAVATLDRLAEPEQQRLRAYSQGVNAYIENCGKKLPWEFRVLGHEPEAWQPEDTLTIDKGFALLLSTALYTRLNFIAIADKLKTQPEKLCTLMPRYPTDAPTITRSVWQEARRAWEFTSGQLAASDWHAAGHGSNNWAVAPHRSVNGGAILCNDPHLRLTLPSTWYLVHLKAESDSPRTDAYEVWGASIPGIPGIHLGHNRWIAWGVTAAICDDVEIYREKLHRLEPDRYQLGNGWQRFDTRREIIAIRGKATLSKTVRQTNHGPVLSDFGPPPSGGEILSLRWTAHEPSQEQQSLYGINRARNWSEFLDALAFHGAPSLNFVYADRDGNIGYSLAGKIPRRRQIPTLLPLEGWDPSNDWQGYLSFEELPRLYNPPAGSLATANNRITDGNFPYYLSHFYEPPQRIRRIEQLLRAREKFSVEDLAAIQLDQLSLHAREFIDMLKVDIAAVADDKSSTAKAAARLLAWDGDCSEQSVAAAIFHVFHHRLLVNLLSPELGDQLFAAYVEILNQSIVPTDRIFSSPQSPWFSARTRAQSVDRALREACAELEAALGDNIEKWQWGKIHRLEMNHALGRVGFLKSLLGIGSLAACGDGMTLNLGFYRHSNPYTQTVGPSLRFIVEFNHEPRSHFVLSSGQSGHPSSRHYRDQTEQWHRGTRIPMCTLDSETSYPRRLLLRPL